MTSFLRGVRISALRSQTARHRRMTASALSWFYGAPSRLHGGKSSCAAQQGCPPFGLTWGRGNMQEEKAYRTTFERWNDRNRAAISAYSRSRHRLAGQR